MNLVARALAVEQEKSTSSSAFPSIEWERLSPEAVGLSALKLDQLHSFVGGSGCVVRQGYSVYRRGDIQRPRDVASAVKPVYTRFLLVALQEGRIDSPDDPVHKFEPRLVTRTPLSLSIPRTAGEKIGTISGQRSIGGGNNQCDHEGSYSYA
jgi:hypothetical protein